MEQLKTHLKKLGILNNINKENLLESLCEIYLFYRDEINGIIPLLICPDESIKTNKEKMRPIHYHSIWFLDNKKKTNFENIDLEYGDKIYYAKKLFISSSSKKSRGSIGIETSEFIVIIVALPKELNIFGDDLLNKISENILTNFEAMIPHIIESEIAKTKIINLNFASSHIKNIINKGDKIKEDLRNEVKITCLKYFTSVIKKKDLTSITKQKAISFLYFKGMDIKSSMNSKNGIDISNIKLINNLEKSNHRINLKSSFEITKVNILKETNELEILIKNLKKDYVEDIVVKITTINDFFEKEILSQIIDYWLLNETIIFTIPITDQINKYLSLSIEDSHKEKYLSKKIDLDNFTHINEVNENILKI